MSLEDLQTALDDFLALTPADQESQLAELDARLERELWTLSGLEAALGGPEAADAAFAAHSQALVGQARAIVGEPIVMSGLRAPVAAAEAPNIGMGLFGGYMVVTLGADAIVSSTNDFKDGQTASENLRSDTTVSGSLDHVEMNVDTSHEDQGVTTSCGSRSPSIRALTPPVTSRARRRSTSRRPPPADPRARTEPST